MGIYEAFDGFFGLKKYRTSVKTEVLAGIATFMTMVYIVVVNPSILYFVPKYVFGKEGIPFAGSMVATIISAFYGTLVMGIYAKRPFAIAPYMGENAFVAVTVVGILGYSWQTAIGAVFIGGLIFTIITVTGLRPLMTKAVPPFLAASFAVGIGLFITFIGLADAGIVRLGIEGAPVKLGNLLSKPVLLAIFGAGLISILLIRRVVGSIVIGLLATLVVGVAVGVGKLPPVGEWIGVPAGFGDVFLKLDIMGALTWGFFAVILTMFTMDFLDTMGTLLGIGAKAGFLDKEGRLPEVEKPMLADATATVVGAICGTSTTGTYIESAAGIEQGGRTGLTAVVVAILFLLALPFVSFFSALSGAEYEVVLDPGVTRSFLQILSAPALIVVGLLMMGPIRMINFDDYTEAIPAFGVVALMIFTFNIGVGLTAGFVLYPLCKVVAGRYREIHPAAWFLFALCLLFYIFYPYTPTPWWR